MTESTAADWDLADRSGRSRVALTLGEPLSQGSSPSLQNDAEPGIRGANVSPHTGALMEPSLPFDHNALLELAGMLMPFGKYEGMRLIDLPEPYVVWFAQKGFPEGKLGRMLAQVYEIKVNGLEYLFEPLR